MKERKPRPTCEETMSEVYTALKLMLMQKPEGCGASEIWRELLQDKSRSTVDNAVVELRRLGHIRLNPGGKGPGHRYVLTDKEFIPVFQPADRAMTPKPRPSTPEKSPAEPGYWKEKLEQTISGLELIQSAIPGLLAGLLDLTRDLDRLDKVKDILAGVDKAARRNM